MTGHPRPRRTPAGSDLPPSRRCHRCFHPLLLVILLLALLLASLPIAVGCGSDQGATAGPESSATSPEAALADGEAPAETPPSAGTAGAGTAPDTTGAGEAAGAAGSGFPVTVTDDNGTTVTIKAEPQRIVSTAPAGTETLFALGLDDRVVGVTSLCDYPPEVADITKIGDFQANTEAIMALSPDLVVGYSGNEEALAPVQEAGAAVIIFNPTTIEGIYVDIATLGKATGTEAKAAELIDSIKAQIKEVTETAAAAATKPRVFYALDNTLWTCGPGSFVNEMLSLVNCTNIAAEDTAGLTPQAYYQLTPEQLVAADPDLILLPSSSGYSAAEEFTNDPRFAGLSAVKEGRVYLFDDTIVTRPGARIGQGLRVLAEAVHPEAF